MTNEKTNQIKAVYRVIQRRYSLNVFKRDKLIQTHTHTHAVMMKW